MQSVLDVLKKTEAYFAKAGLESPKVSAEWLVAGTLGYRRLQLYLQWDRPLEEDVLAKLRERVQRRAKGEPLEYILGSTDFHEISLLVGPGVLIPRKETELLVEKVLQRLSGTQSPRIVDLGTGSGAIALALANKLPDAKILAIDNSKDAVAQARTNADQLGLRDRVSFRSGDWFQDLSLTADCIVSNPPYLTEEEWADARIEVREFEPKEALVAADDGLADLKTILKQGISKLDRNGFIALEMGIAHGHPLTGIAQQVGYASVNFEQDDSGRDRFFFATK